LTASFNADFCIFTPEKSTEFVIILALSLLFMQAATSRSFFYFIANRIFLPVALLCCIPAASMAQALPDDDTLNVFESHNDSLNITVGFYDTFDSLGSLFFSPDSLPSAAVAYSSDSLTKAYGGDWSNDQLFLFDKDFDPSKMDDSIQVILQDEDGHCYFQPWSGVMTSNFGWRRWQFHYGVDLGLHTGDTVRCAFDGVVRVTKWGWGFGNVIVVRHTNGLETLYGHLSASKVKPNQKVKAGDMLGLGGSTGRSTGPHLHFEIRYKGAPINPNSLVDFKTFSVWKDTAYISKRSFHYVTDIKKVAGTANYYYIRSGDTLGGIAARYGTSVSALCRLNGISATTILRIGRAIRVR
jgi:LysM repeat protein